MGAKKRHYCATGCCARSPPCNRGRWPASRVAVRANYSMGWANNQIWPQAKPFALTGIVMYNVNCVNDHCCSGCISKLSVVLSLRGALRQACPERSRRAQDKPCTERSECVRDEAISFGQVGRLLRSLRSLAMTGCAAFTDSSGIYSVVIQAYRSRNRELRIENGSSPLRCFCLAHAPALL
jgi:hypothetical protein